MLGLTYADLLPFAPGLTPEQAVVLIRGVSARISEKVPCIADLTANDAARDIVLAAVLRRYTAAGGLVTSQKVGDVEVHIDTAAAGRLLLDSELAELQALCGSASTYGPVGSFPDPLDWPDPVERY